jgi:mannose-6-phosphate isomerase
VTAFLRRPLRLPPNRIRVFYQGGALIDRLRGIPNPQDDDRPEDWVGSVTALGWPGRDPAEGVSVVEIDGRRVLLTDLVRAHPEEMLGAEHLRRFGPTPSLLVKLLDTSIRLPVHSHPPRVFARQHLGSPYGKTEAWIVVGTRQVGGEAPSVYLGCSRDVSKEELLTWIRGQSVVHLLGVLHRLPVRAGDVIYVPAGLPHAIGPGVFIVELQEPTSFSVLMEYQGFPIDPAAAHLGLGWDLAVQSVDRTAYGRDELMRRLVSRLPETVGSVDLFGAAGAPYFGASRIRVNPETDVAIAPGFAIGIVLDGAGSLAGPDGPFSLGRGDQFLIPFAMGPHRVHAGSAGIEMIRCLPPSATMV